MKKVANEIKPDTIISHTWGNKKIFEYLMHLPKGAIFGYSSAFVLKDMLDITRGYGILVRILPERHPLRKKYGDYVLRVMKPYNAETLKEYQVSFKGIYGLERKVAKGKRSCKCSSECSRTIEKGTSYVEIVSLVELPDCRKIYKRTALCLSCAKELVGAKIEALSKLIE